MNANEVVKGRKKFYGRLICCSFFLLGLDVAWNGSC